jgi:multicomponent Na+:H+ antiporter subunit B
MCLLWTEMGAVDVAFTEAAVGAGVSTVLFFAAVHQTSRQTRPRLSGRALYKGLGLLASGLLGGVLFYATADFPAWADPFSPASSHLSPHYITAAMTETSVPNIVTAVLADYRSFDTMFETAVVLTAGLAVLIILRIGGCRTAGPIRQKAAFMQTSYEDSIIRFVARKIAPFMQLFALYVVAHGHYSPGGGFQGGVILGASFILLAISYDLKMVMGRINEKASLLLANTGILIYAGIGLLCLLLGANFLDYSILHLVLPATDAIAARSHAMLGIEIGVALTVMVIVMVIYNNIASNGTYEKGL